MNTLFMVSTLVLSGGQVLFGLCFVASIIVFGTFATKKYLRQQSETLLHKEHIDNDSVLMRKHDVVDVRNHQTSIKLVGFAASLAFIFIVFAWTTCDIQATLASVFMDTEEIEMEVPATSLEKEQKMPPALPPPPAKSPLDFLAVDEPEPKPTENTEPTESPTPSDYTGPTSTTSTTYTPTYVIEPVVEQPEIEDGEPVLIADQMPRFPGCEEGAGDNIAKKACADKNLLAFIYAHIQYPAAAREIGVEGTAVVTFVVEKDGSIADIKIARDPGAGCGKEAQRVVKLMNDLGKKWTPGKQRGRTVKVRYNLPVKFKLNS